MIRLSNSKKQLFGEVILPSSKSVTNRMLILKKLYEPQLILDNISEANDSQVLKNILGSNDNHLNVKDAGTAYRFLTAYCAVTPGEWTIKGTTRLHERPTSDLVETLKRLGADINYLEKHGQGPLRIVGKKLGVSSSLIDLSKINSSQFASALLMIAPLIDGEFNFKIKILFNLYLMIKPVVFKIFSISDIFKLPSRSNTFF